MATTPRQELHELVDRLDDEQARRLAEALRGAGSASGAPTPLPLAEADIVLATPVLPDDETADEMIATVRRWRRTQSQVTRSTPCSRRHLGVAVRTGEPVPRVL